MTGNSSIIVFSKDDLPSPWQSYDRSHLRNALRLSIENFAKENLKKQGFWALLNAANGDGEYPVELPENIPPIEVPPLDEDDVVEDLKIASDVIAPLQAGLKHKLTRRSGVINLIMHLSLLEAKGKDVSEIIKKAGEA